MLFIREPRGVMDGVKVFTAQRRRAKIKKKRSLAAGLPLAKREKGKKRSGTEEGVYGK